MDFEFIDELNLGVELVVYADDITLIQTGPTNELMLLDALDAMHLLTRVDGTAIGVEMSHRRLLGLVLDRELNFERHIDDVQRNARRAANVMFNQFRHAGKMMADQLRTLYSSLVLSKLRYGMAIWALADDAILAKLRAVYNDVTKACVSTKRSEGNPLTAQDTLDWPTFDGLIEEAQCQFWARLIRTPQQNIISEYIAKEYWDEWQQVRDEERTNAFDLCRENVGIWRDGDKLECEDVRLERVPLRSDRWRFATDAPYRFVGLWADDDDVVRTVFHTRAHKPPFRLYLHEGHALRANSQTTIFPFSPA